jgi:hypothetical protein
VEPIETSEAAIGQALDAAREPGAEPEFPAELVEWLARVRLLEGVPFSYLVPHEEMLPQESIRFFHLNRDFLDAAVDGALSLGGSTSRDRALLESVYEGIRDRVDERERMLWADRAGVPVERGAAETVTGFLLRSRVVSGWPGLHMRAYRIVDGAEQEVRPLRLERLAPAVMLALFDGVPSRLEIEEPRGSLQFGVDPAGPDQPADSGWVNLRDPATGQVKTGEDGEPIQVQVPFRPDAPGVIDVTALREALVEAGRPELGDVIEPAELALQLLQYPYRQPFGATDDPIEDVFAPTVDISVVRRSQEL